MTYVGFYDESKLKENVGEDAKAKNNRYRYNFAKTISMKKFIAEFGGSYTPLIKENLLKLELRSVLTRVENMNVLNIKHVEHAKHTSTDVSGTSEKEYIFGQLVSLEGKLYFSTACSENEKSEKCHCIDAVYDSIDRPEQLLDSGTSVKAIDDENVEQFIGGMLNCIPDVSERYLKILKEMTGYVK
ncbi:MAG: hypothetical protein H6Q58_1970 [Firmicutes bacterium]|nr:hypothetical protein [Bacillota bacterium]